MRYRTLGSSGIAISSIGFGAWGIGGKSSGATSYGATDDSVSRRALETAFDHGITFYDTASVYGDGHSESLIGETFRTRRDRVVIATKVGMLPSFSGTDFSPGAILQALEGSLRRLQTDYVDVLQLHNLTLDTLRDKPEIISALNKAKSQGKIRAYGASTKAPEIAAGLAAAYDFTCLQVNINLLDWRAVDCGLLTVAKERGVSVIARTPLGFGFLGGGIGIETNFSDGDHRSLWSRTRIALWLEAADGVFASLGGGNRPEVALRFCLSLPTVASAIPGMLTPEEVRMNVAAAEQPALSDEDMRRVKQVYHHYAARLAA